MNLKMFLEIAPESVKAPPKAACFCENVQEKFAIFIENRVIFKGRFGKCEFEAPLAGVPISCESQSS